MTEITETKKIHPSPAKEEKKDSPSQGGQTAGSNRELAETQGDRPQVDVIQEQEITRRAYENPSESDNRKKAG